MLNKVTLILGLGSITLMVLGLLLANKEIVPPRVGMLLFALAGLVGLVGIGFAVAVIVKTQAFHIALVGLVGFLPLISLFTAALDGVRYPPINDISTDLENIPEFVHAQTLPENAGREMSFPLKWVGIIRKAERYQDLAPAKVGRPPADVFETVLRQAQQQDDWEVTYSDAGTGIVEAVATTKLLRFRDDVLIRVSNDGEGGTRVDMRSKSRDGKSDLGANAKRIRQFLSMVR